MTQNVFGGGERTLWTSFGCNMEVWTPTGTKTPSLLATSWFWVFFRKIFKENTYLGNKRSTYVGQNYSHQKAVFLIRLILFFYIFTFMFRYRTRPFRKFNMNSHINIMKKFCSRALPRDVKFSTRREFCCECNLCYFISLK